MAAPSPKATEPQAQDAAPTSPAAHKAIHSLILDTGPLIKNDPPSSVLIAQAEKLFTTPSVIPEIRDPATRSRVETTLLPFVTIRTPGPASFKFVKDFARRTGDLEVLSRPDLELLALAYELECERNGGDWRLRNSPGQKGLNGRPGEKKSPTSDETEANGAKTESEENQPQEATESTDNKASTEEPQSTEQLLEGQVANLSLEQSERKATEENATEETAAPEVAETVDPQQEQAADTTPHVDGEKADETAEAEDSASDSDGDWITPSNLKKHQEQDSSSNATPSQPIQQKTLQAALLTSDYAMQNVALRMNLNLVTPSMARITQLKNWVLRCHGCFKICKDMSRQFCPTCGQATLNRVSCSTDQQGNFRVHLKKNFQWSSRGNVYSVPKPVHGSSNGRLAKNAGGQNNWGANLILAEDQKEYVKANEEQRRAKKKDIMDQDYLPDILTGHRSGSGGKIRVGAGKRVNSKKKH